LSERIEKRLDKLVPRILAQQTKNVLLRLGGKLAWWLKKDDLLETVEDVVRRDLKKRGLF
jgi:hypothetical protein